jgi:hypothetical protein
MAKTVSTIVTCDYCNELLKWWIVLDMEYAPDNSPVAFNTGEPQRHFCNVVCLKNFYVRRGTLHG